MNHERIQLTDTPISAMIKIAEGNPGAATALMELFTAAPIVDPDSAFGGYAPLLDLDRMGVYGSRVWMFYKDLCGQDNVRCLSLLRAVQLGLLSESRLLRAIDTGNADALSIDDLMRQVKDALPAFAA